MLLLMSTRYRSSHHDLHPFRITSRSVNAYVFHSDWSGQRRLNVRGHAGGETRGMRTTWHRFSLAGHVRVEMPEYSSECNGEERVLRWTCLLQVHKELRDGRLHLVRTPPYFFLNVLLYRRHWGLSRWRPVRSARPWTEAPDLVHCFLRGRRCTAAPNAH